MTRLSHSAIPRGGTSTSPSGLKSSDNNNNNFGSQLEPIGKALMELTVATWTFARYLVDHQLKDPQTHIVEPLQRKLNQILANQQNKDDGENDKNTIVEKEASPCAPKCFSLKTNRVIRLSFVAWILSEALDLMGILHEDTPRMLKFQVDRVWYNVQPRLVHAVDFLQEWWRVTMTRENLESIPSKYNFAFGTSVGMILAPFLSSLLGSIATPAILVYALAEGNALLQRRGKPGIVELLDKMHNGIGRTLGRILESFRKTVRSAMPKPQPIEGALILTNGGSYLGGGKLMVQQRQYRRSYLFPWRKVLISKAVAISNQDGREPIHPMIAMIRHGFVVGSAIGFFLRT